MCQQVNIMQYQPVSTLSLRVLWFPIWLVLFELATYIANDMILPGMLQVVSEFHVSSAWVATAMTMYLIGGASLQWLLGPWSDRAGRRPIMLLGVGTFILATLLICFSKNIEQFMFIRILQGTGMCFVGAVGYAAIQEAFAEKTAIKVTAMMLNVAMLAPLMGPLVGAAVLSFATWKMIFVSIALLALVAGVGLYHCMPETSPKKHASLSLVSLWASYKKVLTNKAFVVGVCAAGVMWIPLLAWIGESPVFIMEAAGHTTFDYGVWQIPVMGAVIAGSVALMAVTERLPIRRGLVISAALCLVGLLLSWALSLVFAEPYQGAAIGLSLYALGLGFGSAAIYRIVLFSSGGLMGLASAAYGLISFTFFAIGLEACKFIYRTWAMTGFVVANFLLGGLFVVLLASFFRLYKPGQENSAYQ